MTTPGDPNTSQPWGDPRGGTPSGGAQPPYGGEPGGAYPGGPPTGGGPPYGGQPPYGGPPPGTPPGGTPPYGTPPYQGPYGERPPGGGGLGTAALVLGIISLFLLLICGLGVLTAIAGLIVGIVAVAKNRNRGRAIAGIVLSALAIVLAIIGFLWFLGNFSECFNLPTQTEVQQCVERKLGVNVEPVRVIPR